MNTEIDPIRKRPILLAFKLLVILFTAAGTVAVWDHGLLVERIYLSLFLYSVASLIFRWGWVVPCIAVGTIWGLELDNVVKRGSIESQMWETARCIYFGFGFGFLLGLSIDDREFFIGKLRSNKLFRDTTKDASRSESA